MPGFLAVDERRLRQYIERALSVSRARRKSGQKVDITVTTPSGTSTTGSPDQCVYAVSAAVVPTLPAAGAPSVNRSPPWWLLLLALIGGLAQLGLRRVHP